MPSRRTKRRRARRKVVASVVDVISPYRNLDPDDGMRRMMLQATPEQRRAISEQGSQGAGRVWPEL